MVDVIRRYAFLVPIFGVPSTITAGLRANHGAVAGD